MSPLDAGDTVGEGRYRLERRLGSGGMATVWLARDERLDRLVAIKAISDVLAADPVFVRRFAREARVAAGLSHPNLVGVYDFAVSAQPPYLVMEYVAGGTLADRLKDQAAIPPATTLAGELLAALEHVHRAGIVHRDIKPANVLLGSDGHARLTDFGIARPDDATELTATGNVIGTLHYLAPEVARGEPATARSDLYSLGVVLGQFRAGRAGDPVAELVAHLTAPDPADRPPSAGAALATLERQATAAGGSPTGGLRTASTRPIERRSTDQPSTVALARTTTTGILTSARARLDRRRAVMLAFTGIAAVAIIAILISLAGGGGGAGTTTRRQVGPAPPPADAPLSVQLDSLERQTRAATGR